jgi:hypothetical protein
MPMPEGYYYLITSLPELSLTDKSVGYTFRSFREQVAEHLTPADYELLMTLYYPYDIQNLITLIKNPDREWNSTGNFTREELEYRLSEPELFPPFLQDFVSETQKQWERTSAKKLLNEATTFFIDWTQRIPNDFLRQWLVFDQNLKNLLIWLNCQKFGLDPREEVLGNHYEAEFLRQAKGPEINLRAWDFQFREALRHFDNPDIAVRELIINEMRWHHLDELLQPYVFGMEQILGFAIRLQLINRNLTDTEEPGSQRLNELLEGVMHDYQLPDNFSDT